LGALFDATFGEVRIHANLDDLVFESEVRDCGRAQRDYPDFPLLESPQDEVGSVLLVLHEHDMCDACGALPPASPLGEGADLLDDEVLARIVNVHGALAVS
jgi:hypothetical protein